MFFLLRTAFWISVALALLPSFVPGRSDVAANVGASEAVTAASAAFSDLSGLCERRPDACAASTQFATAFGERAQAGAKIVYSFLIDRLARQERPAAGSVIPPATAEPPPVEAEKSLQNTLTAEDLVPAWRGPPPRRVASNSAESPTARNAPTLKRHPPAKDRQG